MGSSNLAPLEHDLDMGLAAQNDAFYRDGQRKLQALHARQPGSVKAFSHDKVVEATEQFEEDDLLANPAEFARTLGYQHGYNKGPVDYEHFAKVMRRYFPQPDVRSDDYESIYIDGHMEGYEHRLDRDEYAQKHGAKRGPHAPDMGIPMNL